MRCEYHTIFVVLVGVLTSQFLTIRLVKNRLCDKNFEYTMKSVWTKYYKDYACKNYDLWKHNNVSSMRKRLDNEKQNIISIFLMLSLMWIILLSFCLPHIWVGPILTVATSYMLIVLFISYVVYVLSIPKYEKLPETYIPYFHI